MKLNPPNKLIVFSGAKVSQISSYIQNTPKILIQNSLEFPHMQLIQSMLQSQFHLNQIALTCRLNKDVTDLQAFSDHIANIQ